MAKKTALFGIPGLKTQTEIKKTIKDSLLSTIVGVGAGVGASMLFTPLQEKMPEAAKKFTSILFFGAGTGLSVTAKNDRIGDVGQSLATVGAMHAVLEFAPQQLTQK